MGNKSSKKQAEISAPLQPSAPPEYEEPKKADPELASQPENNNPWAMVVEYAPGKACYAAPTKMKPIEAVSPFRKWSLDVLVGFGVQHEKIMWMTPDEAESHVSTLAKAMDFRNTQDLRESALPTLKSFAIKRRQLTDDEIKACPDLDWWKGDLARSMAEREMACSGHNFLMRRFFLVLNKGEKWVRSSELEAAFKLLNITEQDILARIESNLYTK